MKNTYSFSRKKIVLILLLSAAIGVSIFSYFSYNRPLQDPLNRIFSFEKQHTADFITQSITPFSGEKNENITQCISSAPISMNKGQVFALVHNEKVIEMLEAKLNNSEIIEIIQSLIKPILGHAYDNSQINWIWNEHLSDQLQKAPEDTQYIFSVSLGEEAFWYCYFSQNNDFFTKLFYPETVTYQTHSDDFSVSVIEPITGSVINGEAPWGSHIKIETENNQVCETWANSENKFTCSFTTEFVSKEIIKVFIMTPKEIPYSIILREGNTESSQCILDEGKLEECQVK